MELGNFRLSRDSFPAVSRRKFLTDTAGLAALGSAGAQQRPLPRGGMILAYAGTYTPNGSGIYLFQMNPSTGDLTQIKVFPTNTNPSWLAFDPEGKYLFAANEISNFNGTTTGSVTGYAVNRTNGDLTAINTVSSGGAGPAHLSVDPSGKYVLVANYGGGNCAVLPILAGGLLGPATDVKMDADACTPACAVGPTHAEKAPPGSFAISGHDAPHAHMIRTDPAGNFVIVNDLGLDRTIIYKFDKVNGKLLDPKTVPSSLGAGPRHFAFHPNKRWFYSLNEEASTLSFMRYDGNGGLTPVSEVTTLPRGFTGTNFTSEVVISADGRSLYACNRLHNSVALFDIDGSGEPELVGETWTRADYPRNCNIDPTGNFMFVCHNRNDSITSFRINRGNGRLSFTGQYVPVGSPAVIVFLT